MAATPQSVELRSITQRIADGLPATAEEVVVTGRVSRGVADDVSDIELLVDAGAEVARRRPRDPGR
jgi:predicted nucleotidyltransferase